MSELAQKIIKENKEKHARGENATVLDLGNCGLTEFPEEALECVWVEELVLSGGWWEIKFETLESVRKKSRNKANKNEIGNLPGNLSKLNNLNKLIVNNLNITDLSSLSGLKNLQQLSCSTTQVADLSPLSGLSILRYLDCYSTKVTDLSPLSELSNLHQLFCYSTNVTDLSPLSELNNLQILSCYSTKVADLSPLSGLSNLQILSCYSTRVADLSPLSRLNNLQQLDCYSTKVTDLSPLSRLGNLQQLYCYSTQVSDLSPLSGLRNLQQLDCYSTRVADLSPLSGLTNLQQISCSSTKVTDLSPLKILIGNGIQVTWSDDIWKGNGIYVKDCPLENPPKEIVEQGNEAILNYWKQREEQGAETINEAKLIFVGEGKTGKTTLFYKLIDPAFDLNANPTDETHGINIYEGLEIQQPGSKDGAVFRANLWDFGGQELQYMTHQFFITPRALYVLLMDARAESPNLPYWFKIISLLAKDSDSEKVKLLLVFNKKKGGTGVPHYQDMLKYYENDFDYQFLEVDLAENDKRWECLKETIENQLFDLPIVKNALPKKWGVIREALREESKKRPHITTDRLHEICAEHEVTEEKDQWNMTNYLHQLGSLLHFQNDPDLLDLVVLKPEWAVEGVYTFLKSDQIKEVQKGKFSADDIFNILSDKNYSRADAQKILRLMSKNNFDICYQSKNGQYVAAQLLPGNTPEQFKWYTDSGALKFRYEYPIMPKGLISRLIVRLSEHIEVRDRAEIVWKKGAILSINIDGAECRVLMREDDAESKSGIRQVIVEVMGEEYRNRKYALRKVRDEVDALHARWFKNISFEEIIPCNCDTCRKEEEPFTYKLSALLKLTKGRAYCNVSEDFVPLVQLLEGVYETSEINVMQDNRRDSGKL